ncbi:hypothetical protein ACFQS3_02515 [Glycomyces mayteni]|uniref:Uncharacterized protein n=1 Tax=Glycomyces mayteni TaxID=543887 RepID=A0ABW2D3F9_9ACTN|nr:hypothetical protein GCM10025732_48020 [Glycomyces mayteni]
MENLGTCYNRGIPKTELAGWKCERPAVLLTKRGEPICQDCKDRSRETTRNMAHKGFGIHADECPQDCDRPVKGERAQWYNLKDGWMLVDALSNGFYSEHDPSQDVGIEYEDIFKMMSARELEGCLFHPVERVKKTALAELESRG